MATIRSIAVSINAITKPFVDGMKAATTSFGKFRESLNSIGTTKGAFGGLLKDATAFGKIGRLLIGGGALAGVNAVANSLTDAATKMNDLRSALDNGKIGFREFLGDIARSIPVLSTFTKLFDEVLHGRQRHRFEALQQQAEAASSIADLLNEFRSARQGIGLSDSDKLRTAARDEFDTRIRELAKQRDLLIKSLDTRKITDQDRIFGRAEQIAAANKEIENGLQLNRLAEFEATKLYEKTIANIERAAEVARNARIGEALVSDAERLRESLLTPLEQFRKEIENIQGLVLAGLLDDEFADRAFSSARKAFERASASGSQSPERIGTVRAIELSRQFVPGINGPGGVANRNFVVKDPQLVETNRRLAEIAKNTGAQGAALVGP